MREPLLEESLSPLTNLPDPVNSEPGNPLRVRRRQFLQTLGVAGIGLALVSKGVSLTSSNAGLWRDRVTGFVYTVCNDRQAEAINTKLFRATLEYAPPARTFHSYFSAPFIFVDTTIGAEQVLCGNGFQVTQFPLYDVQCPCGGGNDLNAYEIRRITNAKEMEYYKCVLAPTSTRRQLAYRDHANYLETIKHYPYNPNDFNVEYIREFEGKGQTYPGYYITHKTQKGPNDKPMGDVLLGTA
jgi:hypothetical protein